MTARPPRIFRGHGLGNDYLAVDGTAGEEFPLAPAAVRLLCDRHHGVGGDGLLVLTRSERADVGLRIINPDGSEAEKSGNGLRIFALFLREIGRFYVGDRFTVDTLGGVVEMVIEAEAAGGGVEVRVEMGRARFGAAAIRAEGRELGDGTLEVALDGGGLVVGVPVSVGNPHFVVLRDAIDVETLRRQGPAISTASAFREGVNVQLARVVDRSTVEALVWERGAGETMASGSSACAVALAAVRSGAVAAGPLEVRMPGGSLTVDLSRADEPVLLGPATPVGWIDPHPAFVRALGEAAASKETLR